MTKKKRQLIGGILLMVLGIGITTGTAALRFMGSHGIGPFTGSRIINHARMHGNYGFQNPRSGRSDVKPNLKKRGSQNAQGSSSSTVPSSPDQTPNQGTN